MMKTLLVLWWVGTGTVLADGPLTLRYTVDLTRLETDSFFVTLDVSGIATDSVFFQFAATAPGTYEVENAGRFVGGFEATASDGNALDVVRTGINQYLIRNATRLSNIRYRVEDTYDTSIPEDIVGPMSGTNIESNNAVVNGQMVYGYFHGFQGNPMTIDFRLPTGWSIGTALPRHGDSYVAESFDHVVDSPALLGRLTYANLKLRKTKVDIYCFSENNIVTSDSLLTHLRDMLKAADRFLDGLPVDRFVFLFHFRKEVGRSFGALEHKYSSYFYMPERPISQSRSLLISFAAHEFFHVVTPLNIHSEIIETYNFETPTPSRHLWLYEGTTEWAAHKMQRLAGLTSEREYLETITQKLKTNDFFRPDVSLLQISLGSYGEWASEYQNIYNRGALTAMLLDMRLLELSRGKRGLRDVIKDLSKKYGPKRSFTDSTFFGEFVAMTYPEIQAFFDQYVKESDPLPMEEYLGKAGYRYSPRIATGQFRARGPRASYAVDAQGKIAVSKTDTSDSVTRELGLEAGDVLLTFGIGETEYTIERFAAFAKDLRIGEAFWMKVRRGDAERVLTAKAGQSEIILTHVITEMEKPSREQKDFRKRWIGQR